MSIKPMILDGGSSTKPGKTQPNPQNSDAVKYEHMAKVFSTEAKNDFNNAGTQGNKAGQAFQAHNYGKAINEGFSSGISYLKGGAETVDSFAISALASIFGG